MKMDWPGTELANDDAVALRGTRRDSMFLKSAVTCERAGAAFEVVVRNVSAGGMLADTPVDLVNGDVVTVELRNVGTVGGRIVWTQAGRFGVSFDRMIDPQAVRKPVRQRTTAAAAPMTHVAPVLGAGRRGRSTLGRG